MKKTISLLLYIVALISTIFGAVRIALNCDLKGPSLLFYIIATVILGYYFIKTGIEIICEYKKEKLKIKSYRGKESKKIG